MSYNCNRCGYSTKKKGNLIIHLNRQTICEPSIEDISINTLIEKLTDRKLNEKTYKCSKCTKPFNTPQGRFNHEKICKVTKEEVKTETIPVIENNIKGDHNTVNNNSHNTVNITISPQIKLNAFGAEDISYIVNDPQFIAKCLRNYKEGIPELIHAKHLHPEHPENHNIKKPNKKDNFIQTYDGKKWTIRYSDDVLEDIYVRVGNIVSDFVDEIMPIKPEDLNDQSKFPNILKKRHLDNMMKNIGEVLDWKVDTDTYVYEEESGFSDKVKDKQKDRLSKLICQRIYYNTVTPK